MRNIAPVGLSLRVNIIFLLFRPESSWGNTFSCILSRSDCKPSEDTDRAHALGSTTITKPAFQPEIKAVLHTESGMRLTKDELLLVLILAAAYSRCGAR